jgi:hypothetical protein
LGLIRHLFQLGIELVVECDKRLASLLRRSFPKTVIVERSDPLSDVLKDTAITHPIPAGSIPRVLGLPVDHTSFASYYLLADEACRDRLRKKYKTDNNPLLVSVSSNWYLTMRLFRQKNRGNWDPVISSVAEELGLLVQQSCSD